MDNSNRKDSTYKCCMVPSCFSTTMSTPGKLFFTLPTKPERRKLWLKAMRRDSGDVSLKTCSLRVCEDHFNIEEDMENYVRYKLMGGRKVIKPNVVPHIFDHLSSKDATYKCCMVPNCNSTTKSTPEKLFFAFPEKPERRKMWLKAMRRNSSDVSLKSHSLNVCEDHFNVEEDMENFVRYKLMGGRKVLKPNVVPYVFAWQSDRKRTLPASGPASLKRLRKSLISSATDTSSENTLVRAEELIMHNSGINKDVDPLDSVEVNYQSNVSVAGQLLSTKIHYPMPVKIEQDVAVPSGKCSLQMGLQDCYNPQMVEIKVEVNDGYSENGDSSTNMITGCTNITDFTFTQSGIISDEFHGCSYRDNNFIKSLKSNFNKRIEHKLHQCLYHDINFVKSLKSNFNKHIEPKLHGCFYRDNNFVTTESLNSNLNKHIVTHKDEEPHICNFCGRSFNLKSNVNEHILTHTGENSHVCNFCGKSFHHKSHLSRHIIIHTGEKLHICNFCGRSFSQKSSLGTHIVTHTGDKPYMCNFCSKCFSLKSTLRAHILTHTRD